MDQGRCVERSSRAALLSSAAVALVAVIGVDLAATSALTRGSPKAVASVVRAASAPGPVALDAGSALGWAAAALLALIVLRRSFLPLLTGPGAFLASDGSLPSRAHILLRRRFVRAYRTGGRCGP